MKGRLTNLGLLCGAMAVALVVALLLPGKPTAPRDKWPDRAAETRGRMVTLASALVIFRDDTGAWPSPDNVPSEVRAAVPESLRRDGADQFRDAWSVEFQFADSSGDADIFWVLSCGPDGVDDAGLNDDLVCAVANNGVWFSMDGLPEEVGKFCPFPATSRSK